MKLRVVDPISLTALVLLAYMVVLMTYNSVRDHKEPAPEPPAQERREK